MLIKVITDNWDWYVLGLQKMIKMSKFLTKYLSSFNFAVFYMQSKKNEKAN